MATRRGAGPGRGAPRGRVPGMRDRRPSVAHGGAAVSRPRRQRGSAPHRARLRGRGMILCRTLGPVAVSVDGGSAPRELLWRKTLALLVYLARSPKRARTPEHLIGLLWGDKREGPPRHSLNEAVRVLRRHAGDGGVETEAGQVRLVTGAVELDTERLDALPAAKDYRGAVELVAGEFLEGFGVSGASGFEDWMTAERTLWRGRSVDALLRRADELLGTGDLTGAHDAAQRALLLDPTSDVPVRGVMRCRALAGDRAGALECYETFAARLAGEVDTEPDTDTKALAERVRRGGARGPPSGGAGGGGGGGGGGVRPAAPPRPGGGGGPPRRGGAATRPRPRAPGALSGGGARGPARGPLPAWVGGARPPARLPLVILFTVAPQPPRAELDGLRVRIGREVAGTAVRLEPLSGDALRDLAHWALPQYNELELDRLARRVGTDSAGIPLLPVELLHAVSIGLDLRESKAAWPEPFSTLDQTLPSELPDAVVAAIRSGFRRLTPEAQRALAVAAVVGGRG